jgi:hypothetical protein
LNFHRFVEVINAARVADTRRRVCAVLPAGDFHWYVLREFDGYRTQVVHIRPSPPFPVVNRAESGAQTQRLRKRHGSLPRRDPSRGQRLNRRVLGAIYGKEMHTGHGREWPGLEVLSEEQFFSNRKYCKRIIPQPAVVTAPSFAQVPKLTEAPRTPRGSALAPAKDNCSSLSLGSFASRRESFRKCLRGYFLGEPMGWTSTAGGVNQAVCLVVSCPHGWQRLTIPNNCRLLSDIK